MIRKKLHTKSQAPSEVTFIPCFHYIGLSMRIGRMQASGSMGESAGTARAVAKEPSAQAGPQGGPAVVPLSKGGAAGTGHGGHAGAEPQGQVPAPGREADPLQQQQTGTGVGRRQVTEGEIEVEVEQRRQQVAPETAEGPAGQQVGDAPAEGGRRGDQPQAGDDGAGPQGHALAPQRGVESLAGQQQHQGAGVVSGAGSPPCHVPGDAQAELIGGETEVEQLLAVEGEEGVGNEGGVPDRAMGPADHVPAPGGHPNGSQHQQAGDAEAGPQGSVPPPECDAEPLAGLLQQQQLAEAAAPPSPPLQQGESEAESGLLVVVEQHSQGRATGADGSREASASAPAALDAPSGGLGPPGAGGPLQELHRQVALQEGAAQAGRMQLMAQLEQASRHLQEEQQRFHANRAAAEAHDSELQHQVKQERAAMEQKVKKMQLQLEQERAARVAAEQEAEAVRGRQDELQQQLANQVAAAKAQAEALQQQVLRLQGELEQQQLATEAAERNGKVLLEKQGKLLKQEHAVRVAAEQEAKAQREGCEEVRQQLAREVEAHKAVLAKHTSLVERHKEVLTKQTELLEEKGALQRKLVDTEQKVVSLELKAMGAQ